MKSSFATLLLAALAAPACGFTLTAPLQQLPAGRLSGASRLATLPRMQEEAPKEEVAEPAPAVADFTPPPQPTEEGFDITKYSMTLSIGAVVIVTKTLAYLGVLDVDN